MKLLKLLAVFTMLFTVNISAVTISGNTYFDANENGVQDGDEHESNEAVFVKLRYLDDTNVAIRVDQPLHPSGEFSFNNVNVTGNYEVFMDNNDHIDDVTPTPPISTDFSNPSDGRIPLVVSSSDIVDQKLGYMVGDICACDAGDGNITRASISIDGDMSDWADVFLDADNTQCDSGGDTDYDVNKTNIGHIQSKGRNLVRFSRTVPEVFNGLAYGSIARVGSDNNTDVFLFYRGGYDGLMHTTTATNGSVVLSAHWHGQNTVVDMEVCDYIEVTPGGDPMFWQDEDVGTPLLYPGGTSVPQEWVGKADGYTIKGSLTNCRTYAGLAANGDLDGTQMEYSIPLSLIKLDPALGFPTYHVSSSNTPVNNTHPPAGIDDNLGPCPLVAPIINLDVNKTVDNDNPYAGENVTYTITVTNSGDATSSVDANDTLPVGMTYVGYNGTDWNCTNAGQIVSCSYAGILGGGTSSSVDIIASVDAGTQGDILTNNVCVASDENATLVCDDENITVASNILQVSKGVNDETPFINSIVTYEINVTNTGPNIAHNVVLNDALPTDIHYIDYTGANWDCTETLSDVIDCNYTIPLGVGQTATVTFGVDVNGTDGVPYNNTACAQSEDNTTDVCDSVILTPKPTPTNVVLSMVKGVDENTPLIGETITYTLAVTNVGTTQATDVNVTDILPGELDFVSASGAGSYDGGTRTISWLLATLDPGVSEIFTITATVNGTADVNTSVNNEVCAVADQNLTPQCADTNFTPRDAIVTMLIDKVVDNELPKVGEEVTYTIVVTNSGTDTAYNVEVTDALPAGVSYVSDSPSVGTYIAPTWDITELAGGASAELNITVMIDTGTEGVIISNEACVVSDEDSTSECDDANLTVGQVIINTFKTVDNVNPKEGEDIRYTITVINTGDVNATNVQVTDTLPDQVSYINAGGNGWTCGYIEPTVTCDYDFELGISTPISFDINVTVNPGTAGDDINNTACTVVAENGIVVCDDSNITVNDDVDLGITKDVNDSRPSVGDTITYTLVVTNYGEINATNILVGEDLNHLDGNLTVISWRVYRTDGSDGTGDSFDGDTHWTIENLASGDSAILEVNATVDLNASGSITNNGLIVRLDQFDTNQENNHAQATITVSCDCDNISSDSSPAMNKTVGILMILMTVLIGLFFVRREEKLNRNER